MPIEPRNASKGMREQVIPVDLSFETGEQVTDMRLYPPDSLDWRITGVRYEVVKALAATDAGSVAIKTAAGDAAITAISIPASSAIGTRGSATLSTVDARLRAGAKQANAYHGITSAKTTAGGKVKLFISVRVIPNASAAE